MPRRRCPVCTSREWHKEPSSGLITCSEGHVLQNYRNETTETTELGPHALRKRTIKSNRKTKQKESRANPTLYHGARARYHYFECLQLILRQQVAALINTWKLPPEFETVCRDVWALHLNLLPHPPPAEPYFHAQEQEADGKSDRPAKEANSDDESSSADKSASSSEGESEEVTGEQDTLLADLLRQASQSESSDDNDDDDAEKSKNKHPTAPLEKFRNRYEVPAANIAVIMLACWTMRLPVMYMDLIRLVESYTLPYLEAVRLLPADMKRHLAKETVLALSPHFPPSPLALHALTSRLARLCWSTYGIHTPEVNAAPMLWRTVRALCGTSTLYTLTKTISHVLSLPLTLHPSLSPALVQSRRKDPKQHKSDNVPPELAMVAAASVVLKLVYGLDGTEREPMVPTDPACSLPRLDDYLENLGRRRVDVSEELFPASSESSAVDLNDEQLDLYLAFCERALLGNEEPDKQFFPLSSWTTGERDVRGEARVRLRPTAPAPEGVQPGSVVRVYNTLDVLGTVPGPYAAVLAAGAAFAGVETSVVASVVERFERRLVRWAERRPQVK